MNRSRILIRAAAIADADGVIASPGSILIEDDRLIARGSPHAIGHVGDVTLVELADSVVLPGLVNVHAHLDLSCFGPLPRHGGFIEWIEMVRGLRQGMDERSIATSVQQGVDLARAGGTALVGDVAGGGSHAAALAFLQSGMSGVTFLEVFGIGRRQDHAIRAIASLEHLANLAPRWCRVGVQPHAPYSCGPEVYRAAAASSRPLMTHLAESPDEITFTERKEGPLAEMLKRFGVWDESVAAPGSHPVPFLCELIGDRPCIAAHVNHLQAHHLACLAPNVTVAYCPRANAYFNHPCDGPPHQYRAMIEAGVNVALGTDSLICLDTPDRISVLDDMRLLHRRDGMPAQALLGMATVNGAAALGFDTRLVGLQPGPTLGLISVEIDRRSNVPLLDQVMLNDAPPRWACGPYVPV